MPQTEQWNFRLPKELSQQLDSLQQQLGFETRTDLMNQLMKEIVEDKKRGFENIEFERLQKLREPQQPQVCEYASPITQQKNGISYTYCDNLHKTNLPRDRLLPTNACQTCFERRKKLHSTKIIALKEINKQIRDFNCWWLNEHGGSPLGCCVPSLSELPCVKKPDLACDNPQDGYNGDPCPFLQHKEWRLLFAKAL